MTKPERMEVQEVRRRLDEDDALLVCAYENEDKCQKFGIPDAITWADFSSRMESMDSSKPVVFYCA